MGMKDWLDKVAKKAEEKNQPVDPQEAARRKREENARSVNNGARAIRLAQKA